MVAWPWSDVSTEHTLHHGRLSDKENSEVGPRIGTKKHSLMSEGIVAIGHARCQGKSKAPMVPNVAERKDGMDGWMDGWKQPTEKLFIQEAPSCPSTLDFAHREISGLLAITPCIPGCPQTFGTLEPTDPSSFYTALNIVLRAPQ